MQRVRRIEEFFSTTGQQHAPYSFFCVDWNQRPFTATWQRERPARVPDFEAQVVWKEMGRVVTLCGHLAPLADEEATHDTRDYQDKTLISLLKSNLQKCVRRQLTRRATETARYLLALDASLFVRRLLVIMLEDVVLHESVGVLVWLTAALSKQFRLSGAMRAWLLGLTEALCREPEEAYWTHGIDNTMRDISPTLIRRLWTECEDDACRDTIYALLFRLSYGGLPGDLSMLLSFARLVRAHGTACISTRVIADLAPEAVRRLDVALVEPCAVDFHCLPNLIFILARQYKQYSEQQIKQAVWHHSSKLNTRIHRQPEEQAAKARAVTGCYHAIRQRLEYLQRQHIKVCANTVVYKQFLLEKGSA